MQAQGKSWEEINETLSEKGVGTLIEEEIELDDSKVPHSGHVWHNHTTPGHFACERQPSGKQSLTLHI